MFQKGGKPPTQVLGWALRSVLQRKGLKSRPSSTPGLGLSGIGNLLQQKDVDL
jgi:hypothetical protein